MNVFRHHLYEYHKGLRHLVLHTTERRFYEPISGKLEREGVSYIVYPLGADKINVFFGDDTCIDVIRSIGKQDLTAYSDEEDFILGIMLGYDRRKQCQRYLTRKRGDVSVDVLAG